MSCEIAEKRSESFDEHERKILNHLKPAPFAQVLEGHPLIFPQFPLFHREWANNQVADFRDRCPSGSRLKADTSDENLVTVKIDLRAEKFLGEPGIAQDMFG